jgi:hypothetical protein
MRVLIRGSAYFMQMLHSLLALHGIVEQKFFHSFYSELINLATITIKSKMAKLSSLIFRFLRHRKRVEMFCNKCRPIDFNQSVGLHYISNMRSDPLSFQPDCKPCSKQREPSPSNQCIATEQNRQSEAISGQIVPTGYFS